jgi:hypothetical protein
VLNAKSLPSRPNLDWLKKTAKQQLAELRREDPSARLNQAQLGVAKEYGFKSWRAMKAGVDALSLRGQIVSATIEGRGNMVGGLLADHSLLSVTGGRWDMPLLHLAAEHGKLDCVNVLLRHGFDVHLRDRLDNATALHWAETSR